MDPPPMKFGRIEVHITHPEKTLFPEDSITKGDLIEYYLRVAPTMLPHLRGRPLTLERYPGGLGTRGFIQQKVSDHFPGWLSTATLPKQGGAVTHPMAENAASLVYLANQAVITPHVWLSRADKPDHPDQMIFDLDPSGADFSSVKSAARCVRRLLDDLELPAYLKTTGSRGLHVAVPLNRRTPFDQVRAIARAIAEELVARDPEQWTLEQRKDKRRRRVFVDVNRNAYGQTVAPAYAVRARRGAPVSVPITWEELEHPALASDRWTVRNVFEKLEACKDPWEDFYRRGCSLDRARARLEGAAGARAAQPRAEAGPKARRAGGA